MVRRQLNPKSALDASSLERAFIDNGIPSTHMWRVWERVCRSEIGACGNWGDMLDEHVQRRAGLKTRDGGSLPSAAIKLLKEQFMCCSSKEKNWKPREPVFAGSAKIDAGGGKLIVQLQDGQCVETVIIEHPGANPHSTVCVSSQVGCQMGCTFCATGTMGLQSQLIAGEIVEQVLLAKRRVRSGFPLRNVVFMGMGEPLDNYDAVVDAIRVLNDDAAFGLSFSNITVSTVGVVHGIEKLAKDCPGVNLALSLHAPSQETRKIIVPSASAFKIDRIMDALDRYSREAGGRQIMIEYILIDGVNADPDSAHALGSLLAGRRAYTMVNLIPYNHTDVGDLHNFLSPTENQCEIFMNIVSSYRRLFDGFSPDDGGVSRGRKGGSVWITKKKQRQLSSDDSEIVSQRALKKGAMAGAALLCTVRWSTTRGRDIDGACGQLVIDTVIKGKTLRSNSSHQSTTNSHTDDKNNALCLPPQSGNREVMCRVSDVEDLMSAGGITANATSTAFCEDGGGGSRSSNGRVIAQSEFQQNSITAFHCDSIENTTNDGNGNTVLHGMNNPPDIDEDLYFTPQRIVLAVSFITICAAMIFRAMKASR